LRFVMAVMKKTCGLRSELAQSMLGGRLSND
jgi:hypothetical protein